MEFIKHFLTWKHPLKHYNKIENCVALNFGSQDIKGFAMYSVEIDSDFSSKRMNNIHEHEADDNCLLIFTGGKYAQVLDQVMEKVENISKRIGLHPLGLFITEENNSQFTNHVGGTNFSMVIFFLITFHYTMIPLIFPKRPTSPKIKFFLKLGF